MLRTFPHVRVTLLLTAAVGLAAAAPSRGQALLQNPAVLSDQVMLNTVPDHGGEAVAFLDYRSGGYGVYTVDLDSGAEQVLARPFYAEPGVAASAGRVAWIAYTPSGQADVYVHDPAAGGVQQITADAAFQNHPDLDGDLLVWQDYRHAGAAGVNADVYLHDRRTETTTRVTTDPSYQDLPRVYGTWIVWQDYRHADAELKTADIFAYDVTTGQERRLTSGSAYRTHPAVWGDLVVWEDYRHGSSGDIYLYDLATGEETAVTTDPAHQAHPSLHGAWILWVDYRNSAAQGDLYGFHLETQQEYALLVHPAHQEPPHVSDHSVVWQDYRDGRLDLFSGTLSTASGTHAEHAPYPLTAELTAAPNPFAGSARIALRETLPVPAAFVVYDVLGRAVARWDLAPGERDILWDGRGGAGEAVPPGVYIGVLRGRGVLGRVLLMRNG